MILEKWEPVFRRITPSKWRSVGKFQSLAARPGSIGDPGFQRHPTGWTSARIAPERDRLAARSSGNV